MARATRTIGTAGIKASFLAQAGARKTVFGIADHSVMGETTLLEHLVPTLTARGLRVSLIKHSHEAIEIDRPGKNSH